MFSKGTWTMKRLFASLILLFITANVVYAAAGLILVKYPTLAISGTPTTTGTITVAYTPWTATVTGGRPPYTCSDLNGAYPAGITVNSSTCVSSGTPTIAGTYTNIVIRATDSVGKTADLAPFQIAVSPGTLTTLAPSTGGACTWDGTLNKCPPPDLPGLASAGLSSTPSAGGPGVCDYYTLKGSGFKECALGNFDTFNNVVLEATNTPMYITVGAATGDRSWVDYVKCYFEGNSIVIPTQTKNPTTGSGGWTFKIAEPSNGQDGLAKLTCDIVPVKGYTRRIGLNVWINSNTAGGTCGTAVQCLYIDRYTTAGATPAAFFVDPVNGVDPGGGSSLSCNGSPGTAAHISTDATGSIAAFDCAVTFSNSPNTTMLVTGLGGTSGTVGDVNHLTQPDCRLLPNSNKYGQTPCGVVPAVIGGIVSCSGGGPAPIGLNGCLKLARPLAANITNATFQTNTSCGTSPGTSGKPGSSTNPYLTLGTAWNCMVQTGGTIFVPDGAVLNEPANRLCIGGSCKGNSRLYQVLACKDYPTCTDRTGSYTVSVLDPRDLLTINAANVSFVNATFDMGQIMSLKGCTSGACAVANGGQYVFSNSHIDDPNGAGGPVEGSPRCCGYYTGTTPTMITNTTQQGVFSWVESEATLPDINGPRLIRNTTASLTFDATNFFGSAGIRFFNLDAKVPVDSNNKFRPMKATWHYDYAMPISGLTFSGGNTTFQVHSMEGRPIANTTTIEVAVSQVLPAGTQFNNSSNTNPVTWNVCNAGPCTIGGETNIPTNRCPPIAGCTVTITGINLLAAGLANGDTVFLWAPAHPDANQWIENTSNQTVNTQNVYEQRYRFIGDEQPFFNQAGAFQSNGTLTTDGTGIALMTSATDFAAVKQFDGIMILSGTTCTGSGACSSGQNRFQTRTVMTKCSGGFFVDINGVSNGTTCSGNTVQLDSEFSPQITSASGFVQDKAAVDFACVACRIGGSTTQQSDEGQMQNQSKNWVLIQNTDPYMNGANLEFRKDMSSGLTCAGKMSTGGNGNNCFTVAMQDTVIYDSIMSGLMTGPWNSTGHPVWGDTHVMTGYNFDNNHYLSISDGSRAQNPGTNQSCPAASGCPAGNYNVTLTNYEYIPSSNLTHQVVGTVGNTQVPDGTPLFPWDADGTAIASGAIVGAMQLAAVPSQWDTLKVGGGGYVTGIDVAADGTKVVRTDTYGGYVWNGTAWSQFVNKTSMPGAYFGFNGSGDSLTGGGVFEVAIAPTNTAHFYMIYAGTVFSSTNSGATWTAASPAVCSFVSRQDCDPNGSNKLQGPHIAVDPNNEAIVYVGETAGLLKSSNTGTSWTTIASVTGGGATHPIEIAFDPNSTHPGNVTQGIYACVNGTGVYHSTDGGSTWALTTGGPTFCYDIVVTSAGVVWVCAPDYGATSHALWKFASGTWTNVDTGAGTNNDSRATSVVVVGSNIYVMSDGGAGNNSGVVHGPGMTVSANGGSTWTGYDFLGLRVATDIPWLATTHEDFMSTGRIRWDANSSRMYFAEGIGVWYAASPTLNPPTTWTSQTVGIENLVGVKLISSPAGSLNVMQYDRVIMNKNSIDTYPTTQNPNNNLGTSLATIEGWDGDYASDTPNFIAEQSTNGNDDQSGYSVNGGLTWTLFPTHPDHSSLPTGQASMAVSTPTNMVIAQSFGKLYYTKDQGTTWQLATVAGGNGNWGGAGNQFLDRHIVCADRVTTGTFYAYGGTSIGVYKSTDGGANWTKVHTGALNADDGFNAQMRCTPNNAGDLWWTGGNVGGSTSGSFYHSTDGGATWTATPNVLEVYSFGFGAPSVPGAYPAVYIFGWVSGVPGVYRSDNANAGTPTWTQLGSDAFPLGSNDTITWVEGDMVHYGQCYVAFRGSGFARWH